MIVCFCYWNLNINHKVMSHISWEVYGIVYISGVGNSDQIFSDSKLKTKTANTGKRMCFFLTGWVPSMCNTAPSTSYVLMTGNLGVSPRSTYTQRELPRMALEKHAPPQTGEFRAHHPNKLSQLTAFFPTVILRRGFIPFSYWFKKERFYPERFLRVLLQQ